MVVYRLSYLWYTVAGTLVTMCVGLLVSFVSSENVDKLDPALMAPFIRKYLRGQRIPAHQLEVSLDRVISQVRVLIEEYPLLQVTRLGAVKAVSASADREGSEGVRETPTL
jgi:hypothetical protein